MMIEHILPLTGMQKGMLFHKLLNPESSEYVTQMIFSMRGNNLSEELLCESLNLLARKHQVLRSMIMYKEVSEPGQVVLKERKLECVILDLSRGTSEEKLQEIYERDVLRGFDLEEDSLMRLTVVKVSEEEYRLVMSSHHIIMDGWCNAIIMKDFLTYYKQLSGGVSQEEIESQLKKEKRIDYSDYIDVIRNREEAGGEAYWRELLEGYEGTGSIRPIGVVEEAKNSKELLNNRVEMSLTEEETLRLETIAQENGVTLNTIIEAVWGMLLQRYNHEEDVVYGKVVSGRNVELEGIDEMVGLFINTIPVRITTDNEIRFDELIVGLQEQALRSGEYDHYALSDIQTLGGRGSDLIQTLLVFQNYYTPEEGEKVGENELGISFEQAREETNYDLSLSAYKSNQLILNLMYKPDKYGREEIEIISERLGELLREVVADPSRKVSEMRSITEKEKGSILGEFNDTAVEYPKEKTVIQLFEEQVRRTPNHIAVVFEEEKITYRQLNERANILAHKLREMGIGPDDYVGIMTERSIEMIVGLYGIIKAGGAYVPIDPSSPEERIRYMLDDSKPKVVLTYRSEVETSIPIIDLGESEVWEGEAENLEIITHPNDLIYLIYTSGTTGNPKGVMIEHKNVINFVEWYSTHAGYTETTTVLQSLNYVFDASVQEIFPALLSGCTLEVISENDQRNPGKYLELFQNKQLSTTPSMFSSIVSYAEEQNLLEKLNGFERLYLGGEALSYDLIERYEKLSGGSIRDIYNVYGPTESTVCASVYRFDSEHKKILIGHPISNTQVYILNGEILCGIGIPGELCIAGDGLARGYLNQPELTVEKFVDNPYVEGRLYRTGDLAKWLADGNIEYLGRIDDQVKIRGFRIELGEVESKLREIEEVRDCAVIVREDALGEKAIYGYVISDEVLSMSEIRESLLSVLPDYMVPSYLVQIESVPLTRNGKLDRRALPEIDVRLAREYVAPRTEVEERLCQIFEDILGIDRVGIKDGFFELGGHSLRATRLVNRIESELGMKIPLKDVFSSSTVELLSELIKEKESVDYIPISKAKEKAYYKMSSAQKRIYLIQEMDLEAVTYNMPQHLKLTGELDVERVRQSFQDLINRHEILRTSFKMVGEELIQEIEEDVSVAFDYVEKLKICEDDLMLEFIQPFDLSQASQLRVKLFKLSDHYLLMIDMHHIISDGMSMGTFIDELTALYNGKLLESLTHQFKDYSEWMRSRDLSDQKNYWINEFSDEIPVLDLPLDYVRPKEQSFEGSMVGLESSKELGDKIRKLAIETGTTEYMIFLASAMVLLGKYANQEDVVIGSPISGRTHKDTEGMLGLFINTLAMRGRPEGNKNFIELLEEVKEGSLKAYEHQEYPFEELIEKVNVRRDLSRHPLFDVMLVMQNNEVSEFRMEGISTEYVESSSRISKFDLSFNIWEKAEGYGIALEYCSALFKEETVKRILEHYIELLGRLVDRPTAKLEEIGMITENEKGLILGEFNDTFVDYPRAKTVIELFEEQVKRTPDSIALVFEDEEMTYREFNKRVNILAHKLREMGVGPDDYVGIITERSLEMIMGLYGIIKSGGAYVPIDPEYPLERIQYMLEDCNPKAILTYQVEIETPIPVLDLSQGDIWKGDYENPVHVNQVEDLIYCIYTSGTTGNPKGVMIEHWNLVNFLNAAHTHPFLNELKSKCDYIYASNKIIFDNTVQEIIFPLLNGLGIILARDPMMFHTMKQKNLGLISLPTKFSNYLLQPEFREKLEDFNVIMLGAEEFKVDLLSNDFISESSIIFNGYGPTETTCGVSYYRFDTKDNIKKAPIGKPISNTRMYILDNGQLCGIGVPGELCIAGDGLARGYLNLPELTSEKFVDNPYGEGKLYRSGDLARWLPDGNIEYMGRIDEQVKIRGFRIELGEIESKLREIGEVRDCAVIAREDSLGEKAIYGYVVSDETLSMSEIRESLGKTLPDYMVPSYLMQIESIPLINNGKLDKRALPEIDVRLEREYVAPRTAVEEKFCATFEEVLGVERVGIKDGFFELGGDSIKAIRAVSKLRELNYTIAVKDIMQGKTIENISLSVKEEVVENPYEQGEVVGVVEKTPIIKAFDRWNFAKPHHFNQAMMFPVDDVSSEEIRQTLRELVIYHDMLRVVYRNNTLEILPSKESRLFDFYEFDFVEELDARRAVELQCTKIQGSINLPEGPLLKAALFQVKEGSFLMVCIHHLVVDGVSWRILGEDFERVLSQIMAQEEVKFPKKTASFKEWSELLQAYAKSSKVRDDRKYWDNISTKLDNARFLLSEPSSTSRVYKKIDLSFTVKETERLTNLSNKAFNTETIELLLSGLTSAVNKLTDQKHVSVMLEGHGREELHKKIEIDRTVGWFTTIFPVVLTKRSEWQETIITNKDMLRSIPNKGILYGLLDPNSLMNINEIGFNYHGSFDDFDSLGKQYSVGMSVAEENSLLFGISFDGVKVDQMLSFVISYDSSRYSEEEVMKLTHYFKESLDEISEYCINYNEAVLTASDFDEKLAPDDFDTIMDLI